MNVTDFQLLGRRNLDGGKEPSRSPTSGGFQEDKTGVISPSNSYDPARDIFDRIAASGNTNAATDTTRRTLS